MGAEAEDEDVVLTADAADGAATALFALVSSEICCTPSAVMGLVDEDPFV